MGYSLYLKGKGFNRKAWLEEVESRFVSHEGEGDGGVSALGYLLGGLDEDLDREELWLHPKGGIRGVTVKTHGGEVTVSLPSGCSGADYGFAWELVRMGVAHGATPSDEEGREIDLSDAQIAEITDTHQRFEWSTVLHLVKDQDELTLPVGGMISLKVSKADVEKGIEGAQAALQERMGRYERAFVASLMQVSKDGKSIIVSNYGQIPTLFSSQAEMIHTQGPNGPVVDGLIPASHFFGCIGDRLEDLGEFKYVPEIDLGNEPELVAKLKEGVGMDPAGQADGASGELTAEDWAMLARAPCLVFIMVSAADGKVDAKEMTAFGTILGNYGSVRSPILSKVLGISANNVHSFCQQILSDGRRPLDQLLGLAELLKSGKISKDDGVMIAKGLLALGNAVASASGGFLGFGPKISKEEKAALAMIEVILLAGLLG